MILVEWFITAIERANMQFTIKAKQNKTFTSLTVLSANSHIDYILDESLKCRNDMLEYCFITFIGRIVNRIEVSQSCDIQVDTMTCNGHDIKRNKYTSVTLKTIWQALNNATRKGKTMKLGTYNYWIEFKDGSIGYGQRCAFWSMAQDGLSYCLKFVYKSDDIVASGITSH